ncbi:hypothetical protein VDG1235_104 [Verrucomicrobiia bacterium DG1235]|nr:hypothetical protein VDG1235_104 [Verrucomicrobiae bacterium DG1235]
MIVLGGFFVSGGAAVGALAAKMEAKLNLKPLSDPKQHMKNAIKTLVALATLTSATALNAALIPSSGTVHMENTSYDGGVGSYNIGGGEFEATIAGFGTFYTFCMEIDQSIVLPEDYDYSLSNSVDVNGDVISKGTAYLFELFTKGALYARTLDAAHDEFAGFLQAAIWILEDEDFSAKKQIAKDKFFNVATNPFIADVVAKFGSLLGAKADDDQGKVKVMNLTIGGTEYQDVLVYVPDSGTTLVFLGFGLAGLALVRRRR